MDLKTAWWTVSSLLQLDVQSDADLANKVNANPETHVGGLDAEPAVDKPHQVRVIDILQRLTQASAYRMQDDIYSVYSHWALLRYIGVFEAFGAYLGLSLEGDEVGGNQRRVMSEELGIGVAALIAERWLQARTGRRAACRVVDVDMALAAGHVTANGLFKAVASDGARRPDYILVSDDPSLPGAVRVAVLECKGTRSLAHSVRQLVRASHQVRGLTIAGRRPPGIAVSTVFNGGDCRARALVTPSGPSWAGLGEFTDSTPPWDEVMDRSELNFDDAAHVDLDAFEDPQPQTLAAAALTSSWSAIAEYSGNRQIARRWAPDVLKRKRFTDDTSLERHEVTDPSTGLSLVGVATRTPLPGGVLEVMFGVESGIDRALTSGDPGAVLEAQDAFTRRLPAFDEQRNPDGEVLTAYSEDGAALLLRQV